MSLYSEMALYGEMALYSKMALYSEMALYNDPSQPYMCLLRNGFVWLCLL